MRSLYAIVVCVCLLFTAPTAVVARQHHATSAAEQVLKDWDTALNLPDTDRGKVGKIVGLYAQPPLLMFLGTKNNQRVTDTAGVTAYFTKLVGEDDPRVMFCRQRATIPISSDAVLFAGLYAFRLSGKTVLAHYSFLIVRTNSGVWRIAHHLSTPWPAVHGQCANAR